MTVWWACENGAHGKVHGPVGAVNGLLYEIEAVNGPMTRSTSPPTPDDVTNP